MASYALHSYLYPTKANGLDWGRVATGGPMFLAGMIGFFILANLFLEGPSYATFLTHRQHYFAHLAAAVQNSPDYHSFYKHFYPYVPGKQPQRTLPIANRAIDRLLTRIFYWIDRHMWKVFLVAAGLFLLNRYVIKIFG